VSYWRGRGKQERVPHTRRRYFGFYHSNKEAKGFSKEKKVQETLKKEKELINSSWKRNLFLGLREKQSAESRRNLFS